MTAVAEPSSELEPEAPQTATAETPRILYKKHLPELLEEIRQGEIYGFLRDRDTDVLDAETALGKELDSLADAMKEDNPAFYDAYSHLPQFREWLIEDILDRTYQDVSDGGNGITQYETDADSPAWVKLPPLSEQIREELYQRGLPFRRS